MRVGSWPDSFRGAGRQVVVDALVSDKAADSKAKVAGIKSFEEAEAKFEKVKKDLAEAKAKYDFKQCVGYKAESVGRAGVVGSGPCSPPAAQDDGEEVLADFRAGCVRLADASRTLLRARASSDGVIMDTARGGRVEACGRGVLCGV